MKFAALAAAGLLSFVTLPAQAHHVHRPQGSVLPYIVGGAIIGGLLYEGTRDRHYHEDHGPYYHPRHHRSQVIDEYYHHGRKYRVCRRGNDVFYC